MEWVDNYGPAATSSTIHGPGYSGAGGIGVQTGFPNGTRVDDPNYHIYGVIWSPNQIQFYRDTTTNITRTITTANLPAGTAWAFNHPFFVLLNQAVGGNWFAGPDSSTPAVNDVLVDYVRVYQAGTGQPSPAVVTLLASANGTFVSAENAGASPLVANRAAASTWEQFRPIDNGDGTISLQAVVNGLYVTVDPSNETLIASRSTIGTAEKFRQVVQSNGSVALQAVVNDLFVSADLNIGDVLVANRAAASTWEQFTMASASP
jgi:hypothetical protein